jgi:hypothetical protein
MDIKGTSWRNPSCSSDRGKFLNVSQLRYVLCRDRQEHLSGPGQGDCSTTDGTLDRPARQCRAGGCVHPSADLPRGAVFDDIANGVAVEDARSGERLKARDGRPKGDGARARRGGRNPRSVSECRHSIPSEIGRDAYCASGTGTATAADEGRVNRQRAYAPTAAASGWEAACAAIATRSVISAATSPAIAAVKNIQRI